MPARFNISLSYLQRYRKLGDGVTFEQVFTGYSDQGDPNSWLGGENNAFRGSGTLGIALRKYGEGAGFKPAPVYDSPYFFMGDLQLVRRQAVEGVREPVAGEAPFLERGTADQQDAQG